MKQSKTPTTEVKHTQGELPKELFLYVTGTGERDGLEDYELLLRTVDHTIHLPQNGEFGKLAQTLVDNYNERQALLDSHRELVENLERIIDRIGENGYQHDFPSAYERAKTALNNAKNIQQ